MKDEDFNSTYRSLGLMHELAGLPLHEHCINAPLCWSGILERRPDAPGSHISRPWVGDRYDALKLLVIGINLNEDGGFNELVSLAKRAQTSIGLGQRRINFDVDGYKGTPLWHRLGCYAALFAESAGLMNLKWNDDGVPAQECASMAYEFIAYANHIKCSPKNVPGKTDNSKPSPAMWIECGRHVLRKEIALLAPRQILLLGVQNYNCFFERVVDLAPTQPQVCGRVRRSEAQIGPSNLEVFGVPHPTRWGASIRVIKDLRSALADS